MRVPFTKHILGNIRDFSIIMKALKNLWQWKLINMSFTPYVA